MYTFCLSQTLSMSQLIVEGYNGRFHSRDIIRLRQIIHLQNLSKLTKKQIKSGELSIKN